MAGHQVTANPNRRTPIACVISSTGSFVVRSKGLPLAILSAAFGLAIFGAQTATAAEVVFWQDPVVTYTNGVRLASSTPLRSHNMYWQCDKEHRGYCNGRVVSPCRDDLVEIGSRRNCGYRLPYGPQPRALGNHSYEGARYHDGLDAIEMVDSERLGSIPNSMLINNVGGGAPQARIGQ